MVRNVTNLTVSILILASIAHASSGAGASCAPRTFAELIALSDHDLESVDVARMNLLCAQGLPGSEGLDVARYLKTLDAWAQHVKSMERKYAPAFQQNRAKYRNSPALFKGVYLGIAIEQDFGCSYNQDLLDSGAMEDLSSTRFFRDSSDIFINGLVEKGHGSCSSLPVLMVALGRRCGYPLYLVGCGGHAFTRWDDGQERVNLEITCEGVNTYPDDHYRQWPRPVSENEVEQEHLLRNYSGREMLGVFCSLRAACLKEHQRLEEAGDCYRIALRSFPSSERLKQCIRDIENRLRSKGLIQCAN